MKQYPTLFSKPMVQAIIAGRKKRTRRLVKKIALQWLNDGFTPSFVADHANGLSPYGFIDDILWVREGLWETGLKGNYMYKADHDYPLTDYDKSIPSIFMPKEACRLFLVNQGVRIERLQDITEQEAILEGILPAKGELDKGLFENYLPTGYRFLPPIESFKSLWEKINGPDSWDINPWVWVTTFENTNEPENFLQ